METIIKDWFPATTDFSTAIFELTAGTTANVTLETATLLTSRANILSDEVEMIFGNVSTFISERNESLDLTDSSKPSSAISEELSNCIITFILTLNLNFKIL